MRIPSLSLVFIGLVLGGSPAQADPWDLWEAFGGETWEEIGSHFGDAARDTWDAVVDEPTGGYSSLPTSHSPTRTDPEPSQSHPIAYSPQTPEPFDREEFLRREMIGMGCGFLIAASAPASIAAYIWISEWMGRH